MASGLTFLNSLRERKALFKLGQPSHTCREDILGAMLVDFKINGRDWNQLLVIQLRVLF
jgi:hypothetical protein